MYIWSNRTRSRTEDEYETSSSSSTWLEYKSSGPSPIVKTIGATTQSLKQRVNEVTTDYVSARFQERVDKGSIINNPWINTKQVDEQSAYQWVARDLARTTGQEFGNEYSGKFRLGTWGIYQNLINMALVPAISDSSYNRARDIAITSAYNNIDLSKANMLETIAEGKETIQYLGQTFKSAIKVIRAVKRLDLRRARRNLHSLQHYGVKSLRVLAKKGEYLANKYMECRYAIRPMIYDVKQICDAYTAERKLKDRHTFRGLSRVEAHSPGIEKRLAYRNRTTSFGSWEIRGSVDYSKTVEFSAGVLTSIQKYSTPSLWGLNKPLETLWAVTPFSFVADWFFNIGDTIGSWTPEQGVKILASWCTTRSTSEGAIVISNIIPIRSKWQPEYVSRFQVYFEGGANRILSKSIVRDTNVTRSLVPSLKVNLDQFKILDLACIFNGFRKSWKS